MNQPPQIVVATNRDAGPQERGERGVDIIDGCGGMAYIPDIHLPRIIALLAQHLAGDEVRIAGQIPVTELCYSEELDDALTEVELQLRDLLARRRAILARQERLEADVPAIPAYQIELVSLTEALQTCMRGGPLLTATPPSNAQDPDERRSAT